MCLVFQAYELHIKRIILDVLLCNFLFPLNILFLRLIHAAQSSASLVFIAVSFHCVSIPQLI